MAIYPSRSSPAAQRRPKRYENTKLSTTPCASYSALSSTLEHLVLLLFALMGGGVSFILSLRRIWRITRNSVLWPVVWRTVVLGVWSRATLAAHQLRALHAPHRPLSTPSTGLVMGTRPLPSSLTTTVSEQSPNRSGITFRIATSSPASRRIFSTNSTSEFSKITLSHGVRN